MTYDQYWFGDPQMARAFYQAEKLRQDKANSEAWLLGVYVYRALSATVGNLFREHGTPPVEYPKEPLPLFGEKTRKMTEEEEETYALAYMTSMVQAGKNWKK